MNTRHEINGVADLPGVGPATAKKLGENGFDSLMSVAATSIAQLTAVASVGQKTAKIMIKSARAALNISFEPYTELLEERRNILRFTSGSKNIDELLAGGIESGSITEFYGKTLTGKSLLAHQFAVTSQLSRSLGGLQSEDQEPINIIYLDPARNFLPERILNITKQFTSLDGNNVLTNIQVAKPDNSDHQLTLTDQIYNQLSSHNIKVVVVDSLLYYFDKEFLGRGKLAEKMQKLNRHLHQLLRIADTGNVAIIITNQYGTTRKLHVLAHAVQTRIYLKRAGASNRRIVHISDSYLLPESNTSFRIGSHGSSPLIIDE